MMVASTKTGEKRHRGTTGDIQPLEQKKRASGDHIDRRCRDTWICRCIDIWIYGGIDADA